MEDIYKLTPTESQSQLRSKLKIILLVDSSGSMDSFWPLLAESCNDYINFCSGNLIMIIPFDNHVQKSCTKLESDIRSHGGGQTNLIKPIEHIRQILNTDTGIDTIIILITDGGDNCNYDFEGKFKEELGLIQLTNRTGTVSSIVLTVASQCPTFIALEIKNTLSFKPFNIPSLIHINNLSEIGPAFEILKSSMNNIRPPLVIDLPEGVVLTTIDGSQLIGPHIIIPDYFRVESGQDQINSLFSSTKLDPTDITVVVKFLEYLLCGLDHTYSNLITKKNIPEYSFFETDFKKMGARFLEEAIILFNGFNYVPISDSTLATRIAFKVAKLQRQNLNQLNLIISKIAAHATGQTLLLVSNLDVAKALNANMGKYAEKAIKIGSIDDDAYIKMINEMIKIINEFDSNSVADIEFPVSAISLESVLSLIDPSMIPALEQLKLCDPSDGIKIILESFVMVGHGVQMVRSDAVQINPWCMIIKNITSMIEFLDSDKLLIDKKGGKSKSEINIGDGDVESANALVPLFTNKQIDLIKPLLQSKLFEYLMTFQITQLPISLPNAHLASIASMLMWLINQPDSSRKSNLISMCRDSVGIYTDKKYIQSYLNLLRENPSKAMITELKSDEMIISKCESLSKPILFLLVLIKEPDANILDTLKALFISFIQRACTQLNVLDLFDCEFVDRDASTDDDLVYEYDFNPENFYTETEVKKFCSLIQINLNEKISKCEPNWTKISQLHYFGFDLEVFERVVKYFMGDQSGEFVKQIKLNTGVYLNHVYLHKSSFEVMTNPILDSIDAIQLELLRIHVKNLIDEIRADIYSNLQRTWADKYVETHDCSGNNLFPSLTFSQITSLKPDINPNNFIYNPSTGFCSNACMSPKCPFYLDPTKLDISTHLSYMKLQADFIPGLHRVIGSNQYPLTFEQLIDKVAKLESRSSAEINKLNNILDRKIFSNNDLQNLRKRLNQL